MRRLVLAVVIGLAACSTTRDPHAPKTVVASSGGGSVEVKHGQRLFISLQSDAKAGYEWRRVEPMVLAVVAVGAPIPEGLWLTPVRSGTEKLRFDYLPVSGGPAQKSVTYDITVPDTPGWLKTRFFQ